MDSCVEIGYRIKTRKSYVYYVELLKEEGFALIQNRLC